jgi:hypothetical protein
LLGLENETAKKAAPVRAWFSEIQRDRVVVGPLDSAGALFHGPSVLMDSSPPSSEPVGQREDDERRAPDEEQHQNGPGAMHADVARLGEHAADLQYQKDQLDSTNADMARVNAQMDLQILRAQQLKADLTVEADRMEAETEG